MADDKTYNAAGQEVRFDENSDRYVPVEQADEAKNQPNEAIITAEAVQNAEENKQKETQ